MNYWLGNQIYSKFNLIANVILLSVFLVSNVQSQVYAEQNRFWDYCKEGSINAQQCNEVKKICTSVAAVKIPLQDKPTEIERKDLAGCSSEKLYYGYSKPPEPVIARKCAYLQIEQNNADGPFDGLPVLMTVYANGEGVKRNLEIALKFACADDGAAAPMEYGGRISHLHQMHIGEDENPFDYCSDTTSGMMAGYCSSRQASIESSKRDKAYKKLMLGWSGSDKQSFEKMRSTWKAYLKAREDEIDQSGTARASMIIDDQEELEQNFLDDLSGFESGKLPIYSEKDFIQSDKELNQLYKKIQSNKESEVAGTVTKEDIKASQRAWLKFRDAWIVFAKQKYPAVSEFTWKAKLTKERVELLVVFDN